MGEHVGAGPRLRPTGSDHLAAAASHLHPHAMPVYDWDLHTWLWVPAWQDARTPLHKAERLGPSWDKASQLLFKLSARVRCPHGVPVVRACPDCRARVLGHLAEHTNGKAAA